MIEGLGSVVFAYYVRKKKRRRSINLEGENYREVGKWKMENGKCLEMRLRASGSAGNPCSGKLARVRRRTDEQPAFQENLIGRSKWYVRVSTRTSKGSLDGEITLRVRRRRGAVN